MTGSKDRKAKRRGRMWIAVQLVWDGFTFIRKTVNGTYRRETPRVTKGRGAAKRRAKALAKASK